MNSNPRPFTRVFCLVPRAPQPPTITFCLVPNSPWLPIKTFCLVPRTPRPASPTLCRVPPPPVPLLEVVLNHWVFWTSLDSVFFGNLSALFWFLVRCMQRHFPVMVKQLSYFRLKTVMTQSGQNGISYRLSSRPATHHCR